jgi:peroxiredoxin
MAILQGRSRAIGWALSAAVVAAGLAMALGAWLTRDQPSYDGSVVLDTPGIFQEPLDDSNQDMLGEPLPDVVLVDAEGAERSLGEFRGTPLVINLWFSNCAPCARELADFAAVDAELRAAGRDVRFVGLNPMDSPARMLEFAGERGVEYDLWRDVGREFGVEVGAVAYPVTLYVDADGRVVGQTGETDADELRANIAKLFPPA